MKLTKSGRMELQQQVAYAQWPSRCGAARTVALLK